MKKFVHAPRWMSLILAALLVVAMAAFSAGCGSSSSDSTSTAAPGGAATPAPTDTGGGGDTGKSLKIVSDLPLQGVNANQTAQMVKGIEILLARQGGKAGNYTVTYESKDDSTAASGKWDPAVCSKNAKDYAADQSIVGVIGTFNTGCAQIEIPTLSEASVAMVSPANTGVGLTHAGPGSEPGEPDKYYTGERNYARVVASDEFQGTAGAQLFQKLGVKKVYVVTDNETYGKGVAGTFATAAKKLGIEVIGPEPWDPKASDYTAQFQKVKGQGVDGVFLGGIADNNGYKLIKDKVSVLGDNEKVKMLGPDGFFLTELPKETGGSGEGMYLSVAGLPPQQLTGKAKELVDQVGTETNSEPQPYTAYGIAAAQAILKAIEMSDGTRESVVQNLFKVSVPAEESAIGKEIKFDENGDIPAKDISFSQVKGQKENFDQSITPDVSLTAAG